MVTEFYKIPLAKVTRTLKRAMIPAGSSLLWEAQFCCFSEKKLHIWERFTRVVKGVHGPRLSLWGPALGAPLYSSVKCPWSVPCEFRMSGLGLPSGVNSTLEWGSLGEGNGNPLQDSCLINPMRRSLTGYGPWRSHRVKQDLATEQQLVYYLYQMYHINAPEKTGCRICGNSLPCFSVNLHYSKTKSLFLKPQENVYKAHIS